MTTESKIACVAELEWKTRFKKEYSELKERYMKLHKMLINTMQERWSFNLLALLNCCVNRSLLWVNI